MTAQNSRQAAVLAVFLACCGPLGPLPGGVLDGELASSPPDDWSFSDAHWQIQLQVRPTDPYSVNLFCVASNGRLYVGSGEGASSVWASALLVEPQARVRVAGVLYDVTAVRVSLASEIEAYIDALSVKYDGSDAQLSDFQPVSDEPAVALLFRLDP